MQAGPNVKKGKEMDSDQAKRKELSTGKNLGGKYGEEL